VPSGATVEQKEKPTVEASGSHFIRTIWRPLFPDARWELASDKGAADLQKKTRRSEIFRVEVHGRFHTYSIEIGLQPLVGPCTTHVVKMQQEIPIRI
jgi:hypothetical protein